VQAVSHFIFFYPLFMAVFWMIGAILFFFRRERKVNQPPVLAEYPFVSILVPCHNEKGSIGKTIMQLARVRYPDFEIIAIDDGSDDGTREILDRLQAKLPKLRVVHLETNCGKAMALRAGAIASRAEYLMCVDADALLTEDALLWMIPHFTQSGRVAAVTGNPRVLNKRGLLARIQIGEYASIIGMVKRSQRDIGRIFTVSGVHVCFRKRALHDLGYWSPETATEDIDISWRLQINYWDVRYEPRALSWILVPETLSELWHQRLRWARGGAEAAIKYASQMHNWAVRRMWPVYIEFWVSVVWCYAMLLTIILFLLTWAIPEYIPPALTVSSMVPEWTGVVLAVTCLLQFAVGLSLDSHYERGLFVNLYWAIWYPMIYWGLSCLATIVALPQILKHGGHSSRYARWKSPERRSSL